MKIAIIGYGNMGSRHARVLTELGHTIIAVMDPKPSQVYPMVSKLKSIIALKPDAVYVCTPATTHAKIVHRLLKAKLPVFVEKPLATTVRAAADLVSLSIKFRVPLFTGHVERYNPVIKEARELIRTGSIGDPIFLSSRRFGNYPLQCKDVDVALDLAIHDIDIMNFLLDKPKPDVSKTYRRRAWLQDRDDFVQISMSYDKIVATIQASWISPIKMRELFVVGTEGVFTANYIDQTIQLYKNNVNPATLMRDPELVQPNTMQIKLCGREALKEEDSAFIELLKSNKMCDSAYALQAIKTCLHA